MSVTPAPPSSATATDPPAPSHALLRQVALRLRTRGWDGLGPAWAALLGALAATPTGRLDAAALGGLADAQENADPLAAADLLDGVVAPAWGAVGSMPVDPGAPVSLEDLLPVPGRPRRRSLLDPAAEARLQAESLGPANRPLALLGASGSPVLRALAAVPTSAPLLLWDPAAADGSTALPVGRPVRRPDPRSTPVDPPAAVWIHPALAGDDRARAERIRARWLGTPAPRAPGAGRAATAERFLLLTRRTPFHLEAPLAATLRALGHPVAVAPVGAEAEDDALVAAIRRERPDYVLSVNGAALASSPGLRAALEVDATPVILWFVDDPELALGDARDLAAPHVLALAWEREAVARLRRLGFAGASYLPHGARWMGPAPAPAPGVGDLLWIGSSYAGRDRRSLHGGARTIRDPRWAGIESRLRADRRLAPAALRHALALDTGRASHFEQLRAADAVAAGRRGAVARALVPLGLRIHGDVDGWTALLGPGAPVHGDLDSTLVPAMVSGARLSVDCAHPQMPTAVTQRVFDVPACGGLVLADDRSDLREHFDVGTEVLAYDSPAQAAELADWALRHPRLRERMARAAQARVRRQHTLAHRVRRLLQLARARFGDGGPSFSRERSGGKEKRALTW